MRVQTTEHKQACLLALVSDRLRIQGSPCIKTGTVLKLNNQRFTEAYFVVNSDITITEQALPWPEGYRYSQSQKELFQQPQPSV